MMRGDGAPVMIGNDVVPVHSAQLAELLAIAAIISADLKTATALLAGIKARLDGGIKTQSGIIAINV